MTSEIRWSIVEKIGWRKINFCPLCLSKKLHLIEHFNDNWLLNKRNKFISGLDIKLNCCWKDLNRNKMSLTITCLWYWIDMFLISLLDVFLMYWFWHIFLFLEHNTNSIPGDCK